MLVAIPSILMTVVKFALLYQFRSAAKSDDLLNKCLFLFIFFGCIQGICESIQFYIIETTYVGFIMDTYYAASIYMCSLFIAICLYARYENLNYRYFVLGLLFIATILSSSIYFTESVIQGYKYSGIAHTKIPGNSYSYLLIYILVSIVIGVAILLTGIYSQSRQIKKRCKLILYSCSVLLFVVTFVVVTQQLGYSTSAAVILPGAMAVFLWGISKASSKNELISLYKINQLFGTKERRKFAFDLIQKKHPTLKSALNELEMLMIQEAMQKAKGIQKEAAKQLGMPETTLSSKLKKYKAE